MYWKESAIGLIVLVLSVFLGEYVLGLIGYPSAREVQVAHPANFYERRKNIEFEIDFQTNSQGLRYKDIPLEKPNGEKRIFVLGDSFTEGDGVEGHETFSAHLEKYFSEGNQETVRFINGGLSGRGPLAYLRLFYNVGLKYNPDAILICLYANDLTDTKRNLTTKELYRLGKEKSGIKGILLSFLPRIYNALSILKHSKLLRQIFEDDLIKEVIEEAREKGISDKVISKWENSLDKELVKAANSETINPAILSYPLLHSNYYKAAIDVDTEASKEKFESMSLILGEVLRVAKDKDTRVWMVFIPSRWQYDRDAYERDHLWLKLDMVRKSWLEDKTEIQKRLEEWTTKRDVPYLDLTPSLRNEVRNKIPINYELDGHWNASGHIAAANIIRGWMVEQGLLDTMGR